MPLSGELDLVELGQVFQMLSSGQKEGRLVLERSNERKEIYFSAGGVSLQTESRPLREKVFLLLKNLKQIPEEVLQACDAQVQEGSSDPLDVLVSMGILDPQEISQAYWRLIAEQIYPLFEWKGGRFEFFEENIQNGHESLPAFLKCDNVLMEAARRVDEWEEIRKVISDEGVVFRHAENLPEDAFPPDQAQLNCFRWVDGFRSVKDLIVESGQIPFDVQKQLFLLYKGGWIRPLEIEELTAAGSHAYEYGRFFEAAHLFERAVQYEMDLPDSIGAAARAREALEDFSQAVVHYRHYARVLNEAGDGLQAIENLTHALEIFPEDLESQEQLLRLLIDAPELAQEGFELEKEVEKLAHRFCSAKKFERCAEFLVIYQEKNPPSFELRLILASALQETSQKEEAIDLYQSLAKELQAAGDTQEAIRLMQRGLYINPENKGLKDRLAILEKNFQKRKKLRRGMLIWAAVAGVCLLATVGFFVREMIAREEFKNLGADELALKGNFDRAETLYKDFLEKYPYSFIGSEVESAMVRLAKLREDVEQKNKLIKISEDQKKSKLIFAAERLLKDADKAAEEGKLADALELMRKALDEAPQDWERRVRVLREIADLEEYVGRASEFMKQARENEQKGELLDARRNLRTLLDRYPHAPITADVTIPFRVETMPPGATVRWEETKMNGRTPLVVHILPHSNGKLVLEREGFAPQTVSLSADSNEDVHATLTRVPDRVVQMDGIAVTEPAISANRLYYGLAGGKLVACELDTGKTLWNFSIRGFGELTTTPLPAGELIFFGGSDLRLYAVNLWGEERWRMTLDHATRNAPVLLRDILYVLTEAGEMIAVEAQTGKQIWNVALGSSCIAAPVNRGQFLLVGDLKGNIHVLDVETGEKKRSLSFGTGIYSLLPVGDERFLVIGEDSRMALGGLESNDWVWERKGTGLMEIHPVVRGDKIFLVEGKTLIQIDTNSGNITDRMDLPAALSRGLRFGAGALYGKDNEGYWLAIEPTGNFIRWRAKLPSPEVSFEVDPRRVWVLGKDKNLYLFDEAAAQFSSLIGR